ncbi:MAG: hypothetical protein GF411_03505 [Candidatus Lokiarchaeota archaeon]|nr:hypothetical protein [Candidatus Lokiarchaeota archaeon]
MIRKLNVIAIVFITLMILPFFVNIEHESTQTVDHQTHSDAPVRSHNSEDNFLTWTSRTNIEHTRVMNDTSISGDHIKLAINHDTASYSNFSSEIEIRTSGYLNKTYTGELVVPDEGYTFTNSPVYGYEDQYVWIEITGLQHGYPVFLTGTFTNLDTDFLGFAGHIPSSEYSYESNTLGNRMVSQQYPETTSVYWNFPSDTLRIAIFSWSHDGGNYTLHVEQGRTWEKSVVNELVEFDTYQLADNFTVDINASVISETQTLFFHYSNIEISNFFAATVNNIQVVNTQSLAYLSWNITDRNIDETHVCEIHISRASSFSSSLLGYANNEWVFEYNFTNFILADDYYFIIRAIDSGGVLGVGESEEIRVGTRFDVPSRILREIEIQGAELFTFINGTIDNILRMRFSGNESFQFRILLDNSVIQHDIWKEGIVEINLDFLEPGTYTLTIEASSLIRSAYGRNEVTIVVHKPVFHKNAYLQYDIVLISMGCFVFSFSVLIGELLISCKIRKK